ncbi:hypothetical protein J0383_10335 [Flavobacterium endoglycinae]|uniref:DUF3098 domain-containing protein n=1 Tax=Flavobacterium endoglycinae TaxID=2816357 RepID=A0ABX7QJI1_9FLAO|nr:hypothetical protein [Flavobacterium endoglycinae]QSW91182.1 hypothetical protein J0383_10335 [Flavobacterium endoglycinae]
MKKISTERGAIFLVSILIGTNTASYILGKSLTISEGSKNGLFSVPLLITIILSVIVGVSAILRK